LTLVERVISGPPDPGPGPDEDSGGGSGGSTGALTYTLDGQTITFTTGTDGGYVATIAGKTEFEFACSISKLGGKGLTIITDFGTLYLSSETLQRIKVLYGDILTLVIRKGSFSVALMLNGKEVPYNEPSYPLFITLPATVAADTNTNAYVAASQTGGKNTILPFGVLKDGKITFKTPATGRYDVIYNYKIFTDSASHWAADNITFVSARGLFGGIGNNLFSPNTTMTRAMFAQVLANIESVDLSIYKTSRFTDVAVGAWYAAAVEWAASVGMVSGYGGGLFGPEDEITREQMAQMLINYVKYKGYTLPTGTTANFNDESSIASWAYEAVKRVQAAGIVTGKSGNIYDPQGKASRAEVAAIFARFIEIYLNHALDPTP
jgi:hypothetical protein